MLTEDQKAIVQKMRGNHQSSRRILAMLPGARLDEIQSYMRTLRKRPDLWTEEEDKVLKENPGLLHEELAKLLPGRNTNSIRHRLFYFRTEAIRAAQGESIALKIPTALLEERDRRSNEYRDMTAVLCGDPVPSRSALAQASPALGLVQSRESLRD